jgi:hypothetical protein
VSTPAGIVGKLVAGGASEAVAFAAGLAIAPTLAPVLRELENTTWSAYPDKPLSPGDAARIVAQALESLAWGVGEAKQTGVDEARFGLLEQSELRAPTVGELIQLIRRSQVSASEITHALRKAQLEGTWDDRIAGLAQVALDPGEIAKAIHRGIMKSDGLLIASPPQTPGQIPYVPPSDLDPVEQAAWHGTSKEQLRILVGNAGLPLGLMQMLTLLNYGKVTEDDVRRSIAESNVRNEYQDVALDLRRRVLTPTEYVDAHLRGYITQPEMYAGAALHGLEQADADILFRSHGRPLTVHQITTGLARGGKYNPEPGDETDPYLASVQQGSIKPPFYDLAIANRYSYPSGFQIKSEAAEIGYDDTHQLLLEVGWSPKWAAYFAQKWSGGGGTTTKADPHVAKAQTQLWTATHKSYIAEESDDAAATTALTAAGVTPAAIPDVLKTWQAERELIRKQLSPTQLRKAYQNAVVNPATGQPWTKDDVVQQLLDRGYSLGDATTFVNT